MDNLAYQTLLEMLIDRENDDMTNAEIGVVLKVSGETIRLWKKKVDFEYVKTERRKRYAPQISEIDSAMMKEAKKGDVNAAKLMYERFDNWTPTTRNIAEGKTDSELLELAAKMKEENANRSNIPGISPQAAA